MGEYYWPLPSVSTVTWGQMLQEAFKQATIILVMAMGVALLLLFWAGTTFYQAPPIVAEASGSIG